jgi:hypothetical protein
MHQPLDGSGKGRVFLGFEHALPGTLVEQAAAATEPVAADLVLYDPVRNVRAAVAGGAVLLTWETQDLHTRAFVVERSSDGRAFEVLGRVEGPERAAGARPEGVPVYTFRDTGVSGRVVFYRIRQQFESGTERLSERIKLGMGPEKPEDAVLVGNFPNPFNPATTIGYEVRQTGRVHLSVWNLAGHQIALLVDRVQGPGYYEVRFEGGDLPSGTYFARLQTPGRVQSRKMLLAK